MSSLIDNQAMTGSGITTRGLLKCCLGGLIAFGIGLGTFHASWFGTDGPGRALSAFFCLFMGVMAATLFYQFAEQVKKAWRSPGGETVFPALLLFLAFLVVEIGPSSSVFTGLRDIIRDSDTPKSVAVMSEDRAKAELETLIAEQHRIEREIPPYLLEQTRREDAIQQQIGELAAKAQSMDNDKDSMNDHMVPGVLAQCESRKQDLATLQSRSQSLQDRWTDEIKAARDAVGRKQAEITTLATTHAGTVKTHAFTQIAADLQAFGNVDPSQAAVVFALVLTFLIQFGPYAATLGIALTPAANGPTPMPATLPQIEAPGQPAFEIAAQGECATVTDVEDALQWMNVDKKRMFARAMMAAGLIHGANARQISTMNNTRLVLMMTPNWARIAPYAEEWREDQAPKKSRAKHGELTLLKSA
jgi:hypothetical protein